MSDKATCPACNAYGSDIAHAFNYGDACPNCGLPSHVVTALTEARERGAHASLIEQTAQAEARAATAERKVSRLRDALDEMTALLDEVGDIR